MTARFHFDRFVLDLAERRLTDGSAPVELNARYLDALALLVRADGRLVTKDRFFDEVWGGIPVTDEALTQCIRVLRRRLGDDPAAPRFIETVPKHGYRFLARVQPVADAPSSPPPATREGWQQTLLLGVAGTAGAGAAGLAGGLLYGSLGAAQAAQAGLGAASVMIVLVWVTLVAALAGGAGVALGIAIAAKGGRHARAVLGGGLGGLLVGGVAKLLGLDAFVLLLGRSPGAITGAAEGLALGATAGLAHWLASRAHHAAAAVGIAALTGAVGGALIPLAGGRLMAGSLDLLARAFPGAPLGRLFGSDGLSLPAQSLTGSIEGALFAGCIVGTMRLAQHRLAAGSDGMSFFERR